MLQPQRTNVRSEEWWIASARNARRGAMTVYGREADDALPMNNHALWVTERRLMATPLRMTLQFDLLRDRQGVIDFYAEVTHGALQLCMTEQ